MDLKWNVIYIMHNYGHFAEFKSDIIFIDTTYDKLFSPIETSIKQMQSHK